MWASVWRESPSSWERHGNQNRSQEHEAARSHLGGSKEAGADEEMCLISNFRLAVVILKSSVREKDAM